MPIADLLATLEAQTDDRARRVREDAAARARAIRASAEAEACNVVQHARRLRREALLREATTQVTEAREEALRTVLAEREALLQRVMSEARARLKETGGTPWATDALVDQVLDALRFVDGAACELHGSPALLAAVRRYLPQGAPVTMRRDRDAPPGFRLVSDGGRLTVDGRLDARLDRLEPLVRVAIARRAEGRK